MNPADLDHTILHHINEKGKALKDQLESDVICYFGQINPQYFRLFRNFVEDVKQKSARPNRTLSLVLRTPGGSAETVERFVNVIRYHYDIVNFIVPDIAMSAGTIFCMSGDKIYMDYSSTLGPIDPQVMAPDGSGYVAALGYLDKVDEITQKGNLTPADVVLLKSMDLAKLALFEQAKNLSIDLLKKWLIQYKFKDWTVHRTTNPGTPVTDDDKSTRAQEVATALSDHKRWFSHGRSLGVERLKELRLEIDDYSADENLREAIRSYNDLLTAYTDRAGLPFYLHSHLTEKV
ncbi:serine dehydrogenasease [Methylobacterium sp. Leaf108]|uniref:SDH family Clp fold serine proteinase n=1 Tax=Methylobacterium sp. Leaf108 TaxID=1736256 RepID=UPI0009E6EC5C|nr:serine dehydrogenasease [Methylobacterium sp. Leaf108]